MHRVMNNIVHFLLYCRVHQMLCSCTSCQITMETGAFFRHCHGKMQKQTQHKWYSTSWHVRIMSVYSQGSLKHILCGCMLVVLVFSLASQYCQTSSWIVFLEEETNVNLHNLVQVLSKFNPRKVSGRL